MHDILIKITNLKKFFFGENKITKALNDINLDIFRGEIIGLLGANGAGKTTLSSILATLHPATEGDIIFQGKSIYKNINTYRRKIGYCPQKPNLFNDLTVRQNLYFAGKFFDLDENQILKKISEFEIKYKLTDYLDSKPDTLSGGYKQRVLIARSLMHNPKLLIFDEPTVGLDPHIRHQLWETIRELKTLGVTIILTTHYIDEAEILSDRICILEKGKIKLIDTPKNLTITYQKSKLEDVFLQLLHEETE